MVGYMTYCIHTGILPRQIFGFHHVILCHIRHAPQRHEPPNTVRNVTVQQTPL